MNQTPVEIFAIGTELVIGRITDTNSQWLARQTAELGGSVRRITALIDDPDEITIHVAEFIAQMSDTKTAARRVVVTMFESEVSPLMQEVMARFPTCYLKAYVALRDAGGQTLPLDVVATGPNDHEARQTLQEAVSFLGELVTARGKTMEYGEE